MCACINASIHQLHLYMRRLFLYLHLHARRIFFPRVGRVNGWRSEKAYVIASIGKLFKANNAQARNYMSSATASGGVKSWYRAALWCWIIDEVYSISIVKKCTKLSWKSLCEHRFYKGVRIKLLYCTIKFSIKYIFSYFVYLKYN